MNIDSMARVAGTGDVIGMMSLKKGLEQAQGQVAQLLQSLPEAPQPAHLGRHLDIRA